MGQPATIIPEKIFFKIGEVCDLVGVQAHVLRYWETEFPMLSPQKNRSGQRTYRRRDVEIALRVKELLYDDLFTIAGAKKKLQSELRDSSRLKIVHSEPEQPRNVFLKPVQPQPVVAPVEIAAPVAETLPEPEKEEYQSPVINTEMYSAHNEENENVVIDDERREALKSLASQLLELREIFKAKNNTDENFRLRKY